MLHRTILRRARWISSVTIPLLLGCSPSHDVGEAGVSSSASSESDLVTSPEANLRNVVPAPVSVHSRAGHNHTITSNTVIGVDAASHQARHVGEYLASLLRPATGYALPVLPAVTPLHDGITLLLRDCHDERLSKEGYELDVDTDGIVIRAADGRGLFAGVQTLRQLLPANIESAKPVKDAWAVAGAHIIDYPKLEFRGAMLDVSRHFFGVDIVKRYIDDIVRYKMNHLHLHLTDDQGWRIQIDAWPQLTAIGSGSDVVGGPGGFYTKADYQEIVRYAASRHITIIPEIDMPAHINAALASVPKLNCNDRSPPLYTGSNSGFPSLCMDAAHRDFVIKFIDDVVRELAKITPGPYIHLGGDEAQGTALADYIAFEQRVLPIVSRYGKTVIGWDPDLLKAKPDPKTTLIQYWWITPTDDALKAAAKRGSKFLLSPGDITYLDTKYTESTPIGQNWMALIEVKDAYSWDPATYLTGVPTSQIVGFEAPLWTETISNLADIEYMIYPRLPAHAERGWSPASHTWDDFKVRLAAQGPRWKLANINYYASPQVPWPVDIRTSLSSLKEP